MSYLRDVLRRLGHILLWAALIIALGHSAVPHRHHSETATAQACQEHHGHSLLGLLQCFFALEPGADHLDSFEPACNPLQVAILPAASLLPKATLQYRFARMEVAKLAFGESHPHTGRGPPRG